MLVLDEVMRQAGQIDFSRALERRIDFVKVCEALPLSNLSVKQVQRHWEQFRRRLREYNRRESEFVALARLELASEAQFPNNCEKRVGFLKRMKIYDQKLHSQSNQSVFEAHHANWRSNGLQAPKPAKILRKIEKRDNKMITATQHFSKLILAPEPNPQQAKVFDRIQMHELKMDLAVVRLADRRIEKALGANDP